MRSPNKTKTMKKTALQLVGLFFVLPLVGRAADTNPPPRLTVELRDGSRVVGTSVEKSLKFHSVLLGDLKLPVENIRSIDWVTTNAVRLKAANGDTLALQPADASLAIKTGFGKVDLPLASLRKLSVAAASVAVPQREGLVGFWPGNGSAADAAGTNNGVLLGGADFAPGLAGQTFNFDVPGGFVKIPNSSALNPSNQVTVEFWMNAAEDNAMNSYQGLVTADFYGVEISNGFGGKMGVNFFVSTTGNQPMRRFGGFNDQILSSGLRPRITSVGNFTHISDANGGGAPVSAGQWHHVAATYDGGQMRLYIDGQLWGNPVSRTGSIVPMLPESFVAVGSEDGRLTCPDCIGQRYFKGGISQVTIYNRALSAAEIQEDYVAGNAH